MTQSPREQYARIIDPLAFDLFDGEMVRGEPFISRREDALAKAEAICELALTSHPGGGFQPRVHEWILACFGEEIGRDGVERNHRFLEEALELVQSLGCTQSEAHQLVDYTFGRDVGEPFQEVGGVMNTLAALCTAHGLDLDAAAETELARVWTKVDQIRAKQAAKPKHSPLPADLSAPTLGSLGPDSATDGPAPTKAGA